MYLNLLSLVILIHNTVAIGKHDIELESMLHIDDFFMRELINNLQEHKNFKSEKSNYDIYNKDKESSPQLLKTIDHSNETGALDSSKSNMKTSKKNNDERGFMEQREEKLSKEIDTGFNDSEKESDNSNENSRSKNENINLTIPLIDKRIDEKSSEYTDEDKNIDSDKVKSDNDTNVNHNFNYKNTGKMRYFSPDVKQLELSMKSNSIESADNFRDDESHDRIKRETKHFPLDIKETSIKYNNNKVSEKVAPILSGRIPSIQYDPRTKDLLDNIVNNGIKIIQEFRHILRSKLPKFADKLSSDDNFPLDNAIGSYSTKINSYISFVMKQEMMSEIDREYSLLDLIASSRLLLHNNIMNLLEIFEKNVKNVTQYEKDLVAEEINKQILNYKRQEIINICEKLNVCRAFPGISDYFAELISDVFRLPDDIIRLVVKGMANLITKRTHFFKSFMKDNIADMIGAKLQGISLDLQKLKDFFSHIGSIIIQRFKLMKTDDYILKIKAKAVRILIDIIDKTFSLATGEELTVITFDTVVNALKDLVAGNRANVDIPLKLFMEHFVGVIKYNWDDIVRDEVAVLTEVIMTGQTDNKYLYKELFSKGSAFVRGETLISDETF